MAALYNEVLGSSSQVRYVSSLCVSLADPIDSSIKTIGYIYYSWRRRKGVLPTPRAITKGIRRRKIQPFLRTICHAIRPPTVWTDWPWPIKPESTVSIFISFSCWHMLVNLLGLSQYHLWCFASSAIARAIDWSILLRLRRRWYGACRLLKWITCSKRSAFDPDFFPSCL